MKRVLNKYNFIFLLLLISISGYGQQPKLMLPIGHTSYVNSAKFSPNGKLVLTASGDKTAKIWNSFTGALLMELQGHDKSVMSANFSPDGNKVVTASEDKTLIVWDTQSGTPLAILKGHTNIIMLAEFSPDGNYIVSASYDKTIKLWDAKTGVLLYNLTGHKTASEEIWSSAREKLVTATFSPDSKKIVTSAEDNTAKIWDVKTGTQLVNLIGHKYTILFAAFSPDGRKVVTSSINDNSGKIWDVETGELLVDLIFEDSTSFFSDLNSAIFSPDGKKIITASADNTAKIWDAETGKLLANLKGHTSNVKSAVFSTDGLKIVTASFDETAKIWDAKTGSFVADLKGHTHRIESAFFSSDCKNIVTASSDGTAKIWEVETGSLLSDLVGHTDWVRYAPFTEDSKNIIMTFFDNKAITWDLQKGIPIYNSKEQLYFPEDNVSDSPNGKTRAMFSSNNNAMIINNKSNSIIKLLKGHTGDVTTCAFSPDGKKIVTASVDKTANIWNLPKGNLLVSLKGHKSWVISAIFSPDNKKILTGSGDGTAKVWDAQSGSILFDLKGHKDEVNFSAFSPDNQKIVTSSQDNTCKLWNAITGNLIYTFFMVNNKEYFGMIPSGYYRSTPDASKLLHYVTKDLKVITFEQLDVKYNRPDKVLEAIGNTNTELIGSYRRAYEKRLKKLGIDPTSFRDGYSVPEADFTNRDQIEFEQKNETLKLQIKSNDSIYKLDRYNVWVNEVPVYGQKGISLKDKNSNFLDTTISLKLSQGENKIETSITNVNGTESYRMPLIVNYTPSQSIKEKTHFIGIGIDKFDAKGHNLKYSVKDIRDLALKLKEKFGQEISIDTLFNESVTIGNVKSLKKKLLETNINDKVIISYSGHGLLSKDYDYFLSTYTVNFDDPTQNGLPYDELENLLDNIPARKKLMLIDACHSGEVDKEDLISINETSDSLKKGSIVVAYKKEEKHLGLKNSFELMQSLFVNVGKSTGATIISAAAGTQFALESNDLKNGVFTYCILEAMQKNNTIKISELKNSVGKRVEELTNGLQKPTSRNETIAVDWNVW
jgi:WD40 repeat protein